MNHRKQFNTIIQQWKGESSMEPNTFKTLVLSTKSRSHYHIDSMKEFLLYILMLINQV